MTIVEAHLAGYNSIEVMDFFIRSAYLLTKNSKFSLNRQYDVATIT